MTSVEITPQGFARPDRVALPALRPGHFLVLIVILRWLAGILENLTEFGGLSESVAATGLAVLVVLTARNMVLSRAAIMLVAGFFSWAAIAALSFLANPNAAPAEALQLILLLGFYALLANGLFLWVDDGLVQRCLPTFISAFIVTGALLAAWQEMSGTGFVRPGLYQVPRAQGSDVHPVSFGVQIVAAMTATVVSSSKALTHGRYRTVILLALGSAALYLTLARTAWLVGAMVLVLMLIGQRGFARKCALLLIGAIAVAALLHSGRFEDLNNLPRFLRQIDLGNIVFDHRFVDNSISWRIVNWGYGLRQAMEAPLLGHGPGQSAIASAFHLEMHSLFLEVFFELGLVGLGALALVLMGFVRLHLLQTGPRPARFAVHGFGLALLTAAALSTSMVDQLMSIILYLILLRIGAARPT